MTLAEILNRGLAYSPACHVDAIDHGQRIVDAVLASLAHLAVEATDGNAEIVVDRAGVMALAEVGREVAEAMAHHGNELFRLQRGPGVTVDAAATAKLAEAERAVRNGLGVQS